MGSTVTDLHSPERKPASTPTVPASEAYEGLAERVRRRTALVGVVGLGYVGLPLARAFAARGWRVLGFDTDPAKVDRLRRGQSYIGHIPDAAVREMLAGGFDATADAARLGEPDVVIVCVPT